MGKDICLGVIYDDNGPDDMQELCGVAEISVDGVTVWTAAASGDDSDEIKEPSRCDRFVFDDMLEAATRAAAADNARAAAWYNALEEER